MYECIRTGCQHLYLKVILYISIEYNDVAPVEDLYIVPEVTPVDIDLIY